jgi:hypothetical protein
MPGNVADGFNFIDLAIPDLEDMSGRQVKSFVFMAILLVSI